jgi:hypothetical protein
MSPNLPVARPPFAQIQNRTHPFGPCPARCHYLSWSSRLFAVDCSGLVCRLASHLNWEPVTCKTDVPSILPELLFWIEQIVIRKPLRFLNGCHVNWGEPEAPTAGQCAVYSPRAKRVGWKSLLDSRRLRSNQRPSCAVSGKAPLRSTFVHCGQSAC